MESSVTSPTASRLLVLADNTLVSVLERNRLKSLDLEPSASEEADIQRNLLALRDGITTLDKEQSTAETDSSVSSRALKSREDALIRLQTQFDKLVSLLQDGQADTILAQLSTPRPSRSSLVYPSNNDEYSASRSRLLNSSNPRPKTPKTVRFSDNLIDMQPVTPDPLSIAADEARNSANNSEVLLLQQRIMQQQDDSLDRLSESISRQRELSIQIGDELDSHIELLGEVDRLVDWGQHRLDGARKRLDYVSRKTKENRTSLHKFMLFA
ncbi:hypothetical protein V1509DRAFT_617046 [Lipomyces kononenkoae]